MKRGLTNIELLLDHLNEPQTGFQSLHIAGTNGKGSVSHMLASVLQEQGFRTGLYTSPHLLDFRERIRVNGEVLSREEVVAFAAENRDFIASKGFSFFEVSVAMAFYFFSKKAVQYAVVETGLGGRWDSTNVILPILSVITNISLDHTEVLGDSLSAIAAEKAGIIKPGIPVVIGEKNRQTRAVFKAQAAALSAPLYYAEDFSPQRFETDLKGAYQRKNLQTTWAAFSVLRRAGLRISDASLRRGLCHVVRNTGLRGRWEKLAETPLTIADTAHNKAGLCEVVAQLDTLPKTALHLVLGFTRGRNIESLIRLFPREAFYYFSKPDVLRGAPTSVIEPIATRLGLRAGCFESIPKALEAARAAAHLDHLIYVGGSTFAVAEVLK